MAAFQVKIIVGAIQIRRHHRNKIGTVLQVETFAKLEAGNLGYGIGLVGIFQRAGQESIFVDRLSRITGINTAAAQKQKLLNPMTISRPDEVLLNLKVAVNKVRPVHIVGLNATHLSGRQHHIFRLFCFEKSLYRRTVHQIQLSVTAAQQVLIAFGQ